MSQVARSDLRERICDAPSAKVVVLRAPAGFGKTTLMVQVMATLAERGTATVWLTCDAADNDIGRFLAFLTEAIERLRRAGEHNSMIGAHEAIGPLALNLIDRIAAIEPPFALFIDDLESLHNAAALALIRQLIDQLPVGGRLILGSRAIPDIGLPRLRARGTLLEIDPTELRFSIGETQEFLNQRRGLGLNHGVLAKLHATTEGWPVALWLASLALERCDDPAELVSRFSDSAMLADYLAEEVLSRQPPEVLDFLLRTSILTQLCASLCDAVCGCTDSLHMLDRLERANLFVVPLDGTRQWFRYHGLFSGYLRAQLERARPQEVASLHRAAAAWYLDEKRPVPAIEHALASGDLDYALPLFAGHAERLLAEGRVRLLVRLLDMVPPQSLTREPRLRMIHIWATSFTRGALEGMALLGEAEAGNPNEEFNTHAMGLRPMLLCMLDRHDEAYEVGKRNLGRLAPSHDFPHAILLTSLAYVSMVVGRYAEARGLLDKGRPSTPGGPFTLIYAQCVEGAVDLMHGRLRQATARFRLAAGADSSRDSSQTNGNAMAGTLLAEVLYEADQLIEAERLLRVYVPLMQELGMPDHLISGHRSLARIQQQRGERDAALQTIAELEYLGQRLGLPRLIGSARLERSRLALMYGDHRTAREELQRARAVGDWSRFTEWSLFGNDTETPFEAQMRFLIHTGSSDAPLAPLRQGLKRAELARRHRRVLKLKILLALALERSGNDKAATRMLRECLQFGAAEQFVRSFLDEGEPFQGLLAKLLAVENSDIDRGTRDGLKSYFAQIGARRSPTREAVTPTSTDSLREPLTSKELQVLQLLAEGLSNARIADRLFVSQTTVRTHLRSVNAKLHVHNRTQASAVGRRLGLIK